MLFKTVVLFGLAAVASTFKLLKDSPDGIYMVGPDGHEVMVYQGSFENILGPGWNATINDPAAPSNRKRASDRTLFQWTVDTQSINSVFGASWSMGADGPGAISIVDVQAVAAEVRTCLQAGNTVSAGQHVAFKSSSQVSYMCVYSGVQGAGFRESDSALNAIWFLTSQPGSNGWFFIKD